MTQFHLADVSHYQNVAWATYAAWSPAAIAKATQGTSSVDPTFAARQPLMRQHLKVRGYYHFLEGGVSATAQARHFAATVGQLQDGEFLVCDAEDAPPNVSYRSPTWTETRDFMVEVEQLTGEPCWLYSGASYYTSVLRSGRGLPNPKRRWIAAYNDHGPGVDCALWQHTAGNHTPGAGLTDCSIFYGSAEDLLALTKQPPKPAPIPKPTPIPDPEDDDMKWTDEVEMPDESWKKAGLSKPKWQFGQLISGMFRRSQDALDAAAEAKTAVASLTAKIDNQTVALSALNTKLDQVLAAKQESA